MFGVGTIVKVYHMTLKIKKIPIGDLVPYDNNARIHSDEQVSQIAASIREFGFTNPVLCDGGKGVIAGHGRILAAKELGLDTVPVIELSHLSEVQKKAYILADNKLADNALWDDELVKIEISALEDENFDIEIIGFNSDDFDSGLVFGGDGVKDPTTKDIKESNNVYCPKCGCCFEVGK